MSQICLDLDNDLYVNSDNQLDIKIASGSTLEIKTDGLYAAAPDGDGGSGGTGYVGSYTSEGIRLGYTSPFTLDSGDETTGRILGTNIIHRVFTSTSEDGTNLEGFRSDIDYVLAGDMYRVKNSTDDDTYTYYLVTGTSYNNGLPGNKVTSYVRLGSW